MRPSGDVGGAWFRPEQIWSGSGWLFWAESWVELRVGHLHGSTTVSYWRSVLEPPGSLFDDVLDLVDGRDPTPIAKSWGPLGVCACGWSGRPDSWWPNLHPPHQVLTNWTTEDGTETLVMRREELRTWERLGSRAWNAYRLAEDARSVGSTSEAAHALGRAWHEDREYRSTIVEVERLNWAQLRDAQDTDDGPQGLSRWLASRVIQHSNRMCVNPECHALFEPSRNRRYCEACQRKGIPARLRKRRERQRGTDR